MRKKTREQKTGQPVDLTATKKALVREKDALAKLLDDKLAELESLRRKGSETWDREWEIVGEILESDPPLWRGRYSSEVKFLAKELPGEDRRAVYRNVLVAGAFRPENIEARGVAVLEEIALYVKEKSGMTERPRALDLSRIVIEVPNGRAVRRAPATKVIVEEVRAARKALGKKKPKAADGPRTTAIRQVLARRKSLAGIRATIGEQHATFTRVELERLVDLGQVLAALKLPKPES